MQLLGGLHIEVQQAGHGQIDLLHLFQREAVHHAGQLLEIALHQSHGRVGTQLAPLLAGEIAIGRKLQPGTLKPLARPEGA